MLIGYKHSQASIVLRIKILNSSLTTGAGLTGLTSASTGLIISTIADNEATATAYTASGSTIETIATLGTYAAPTATKCRFREVDATNHKGVYEVQLADARFAVSSAKSLLVSISGATNAAETDAVIPLNLAVESSSLGTQAKADVNAEVVDCLNVDTYAEPSSVPAATSTLVDKIKWLFALARNKRTQTSTTELVRNDADSATVGTSTKSDSAGTFTRGKFS